MKIEVGKSYYNSIEQKITVTAIGETYLLCVVSNGQEGIVEIVYAESNWKPAPSERWVNLYKRDWTVHAGALYRSEEITKAQIDPDREYLTTVKVDWTDE